ncbi:CBO0543 family protein [Paenibacillus filicis]|uniref:CBO0543 family protein n=1 Tax=Paenibacillus filicis TaxID=669464 RepID=A0ABU9DHI8_9BACL
MHLFLAVLSIFATWKWGDWKHWKQYQPTMLYITAGGMLYEFITHDRNLWLFHPDLVCNQKMTVILYAVLTMPLNVLIFLSTLPRRGRWRTVLHVLYWVAIYSCSEWLLQYLGKIEYSHGWSFWHSVLFDLMMFPMLILHHKKPLAAYLLSVFITIGLTLWYEAQT